MALSRVGVGFKKIPSNTVWASEAGFISQMRERSQYLTDALEEILQSFEDESPEIMLEAMGPIFQHSQELCPKLTGDLVRSGYLEISSRGKIPTVEIGYAKGGNPRYAVYVHEMVQIPHKPPTQAKFLEVAVLQGLDDLEKRLERGYGELLGD